MVPVEQRVIEEELDLLLAAGVRQRLQGIRAIGRGVDDVVVGQLAGEHAEAVVVLARDGDVAGAGPLGQLDPGVGVEPGRIEARGELGVLADRQLVVLHDPLALGQERVDAPVDEQAELGILEPLPGRRVALVGRRGPSRGTERMRSGRHDQDDGQQGDPEADRPALRRDRESDRLMAPSLVAARSRHERRTPRPGPYRYDRRSDALSSLEAGSGSPSK